MPVWAGQDGCSETPGLSSPLDPGQGVALATCWVNVWQTQSLGALGRRGSSLGSNGSGTFWTTWDVASRPSTGPREWGCQ